MDNTAGATEDSETDVNNHTTSTSSAISTDNVPRDGRAPQGSVIPPDLSSPLPPPQPTSLSVVDNYPEPIAASNKHTRNTSSAIATGHVTPEGLDGRAPQASVILLDFSSPLLPPQPMNYNSLPVVGNYPEPIAANSKHTSLDSVISSDHVPPEGWDGRVPQALIIPLDFSSPLCPRNSLPVVGDYPEPTAGSNEHITSTSSVISTDNVPPEGWDGKAPQGSIIPPDFSSPLPPPQLMNYNSPIATSNKDEDYNVEFALLNLSVNNEHLSEVIIVEDRPG
ncbi:uncharacterized protein [Dysidea avara]|uniref:uncharacterized protein isoform X2 n=1 Tax=Dysidea avara TaxID=196820 RepID=UPI003326D187